jgi:hypothetical protein
VTRIAEGYIDIAVLSSLCPFFCSQTTLTRALARPERYDGRSRNPFDEVEAGHWYARAMSSYGLLQGLSGARYDAVDKVLYLQPSIKGDFRSFLSTATGYGMVGVHNGTPFVEVVFGQINYTKIKYVAA